MARRLITGHSPYEGIAGFSRAVVAGDRVHVSGTAPIPADGAAPPDGAYDQAKLVLAIIGEALTRAGSGLEHVVRTNIYVTAREHWPEVARAHGQVFGDVRPAATCIVADLLDPAWKVEIEAEAVLP
jgi:enamine deaminase RidA (YjgF/YER057c/UK114 family)